MRSNKVLLFGLAGAVGCLLGWAVGEGLLAVGLPDDSSETSTSPSLIATPEPPDTTLVSDEEPPSVPDIPDLPDDTQAASVPPPPEFRERLEREQGQQFGDIRISLLWNNYNDLDLHCIDPNDEHIFFKHRNSRSGGELDVDQNVRPESEEPVENIYWPIGRAPSGEYQIYVHHFKHHSNLAPSRTKYKVNLSIEGRQQTFEGELSFGDPAKLVHEFTLKPVLQIAAPSRMEVLPGGTNRMRVRIARTRFTGPVAIQAQGALDGVSLPDVTIPAGHDEIEVEVAADSDATGGDRVVRLVASGGGVTTETPIVINVKVPAPTLALAAPEQIAVHQNGTNRLKFRIARRGFDSPVTVRADGLTGVSLSNVTLAAGQTEGEFEVRVDSDLNTGNYPFRLIATGGTAEAESPTELSVLKSVVPASTWSWWMILLIGLWTALLTIGLALALVAMQNYWLRRPLLAGSPIMLLVGGGAAVGLLSGAMGQTLFMALSLVDFLPRVGFLIGWALLGGLVGYGIAYFIPNLQRGKSLAAGAVGGTAGALVFVLMTMFAGDIVGRCAGAMLLGLSIGLMVALVEKQFRQAWLEVRYGQKEFVTVNLGPEPVKVGSDARACAVYARNAAPVAFRYWMEQGMVKSEDMQTHQVSQVSVDQQREIGAVTVTVRGGQGPAQPQSVRKVVPPPPKPPSKRGTSPVSSPPNPGHSTGRPLPPPPAVRSPKTPPAPARPATGGRRPEIPSRPTGGPPPPPPPRKKS